MPPGAALFPAAIAIAITLGAPARADPLEGYVIPPGQEPLVLEMLGAKEALPGGCSLRSASIDRSIITARYACDGGVEQALELRHASQPEGALATTASFAIAGKAGAQSQDLINAIAPRVRAREGRFYWLGQAPSGREEPAAEPSNTRKEPERAEQTSGLGLSSARLGALQAIVALVLLALSLVALPRAYLRAYRVWRPAPAPERCLLGASIALGAALRWIVAPLWIVTVFIGYRMTQQAIELLPVSHYGIGATALYHALLTVLPRDHLSILRANSVLGVLSLPLFATFAARMLDDRRAGAVTALLVALVPLFIKNDASDANHVPCLLWLFAGLVLWEEALDTDRAIPLAASVVLLALAAIARPEMPVLVPLVVALVTAGLGPREAQSDARRPRALVLVIAALAWAAFVLPQILHVASAIGALQSRSSLEGFSVNRLVDAPAMLITKNAVLRPNLYPVVLLAFAAFALLGPSRRRPHVALALLAVASLAIYSIDICWANMARVHVPGALFVTILAASGIARAWGAFRALAPRAIGALLLVASAVPTAILLWAPTNEQAEEELIRASLAKLPAGQFTLVLIGADDQDKSRSTGFTHYHFPTYLLSGPGRSALVLPVSAWEARPNFDVPAYFYAGVRCYASMRPEGTPPPPGNNLQAPCARMAERFDLEPVLERVIPNRGDVWIDYYGDSPTLDLGLYRIRPRAAAPRQ